MITDIGQARNEIFSMLKAAWDAAAWPASTPKPTIRWQGRESNTPPDITKPYARATVVHAQSNQGSLSDEGGTRLWASFGVITVQCFGALSGGRGLEDAELMAGIARSAYRGKESESCIWFRNVSVKEIGPSDAWFQLNMTAEFDYDERS